MTKLLHARMWADKFDYDLIWPVYCCVFAVSSLGNGQIWKFSTHTEILLRKCHHQPCKVRKHLRVGYAHDTSWVSEEVSKVKESESSISREYWIGGRTAWKLVAWWSLSWAVPFEWLKWSLSSFANRSWPALHRGSETISAMQMDRGGGEVQRRHLQNSCKRPGQHREVLTFCGVPHKKFQYWYIEFGFAEFLL